MSLSVLGCVVNGPGEARETDIGITGGGNGKHMVYLSGVTDHHVQDAGMIDHIVRLVEAKAAEIEAGISQTPRRGVNAASTNSISALNWSGAMALAHVDAGAWRSRPASVASARRCRALAAIRRRASHELATAERPPRAR